MTASIAACDNGTSDTGGSGPMVVAGSGNATSGGGSGNVAGAPPAGGGAPQTGAGAPGTAGTPAGTAGAGVTPEGIPLSPVAGWVPAENAAMIQGAVFTYADPTSLATMMDNLKDTAATKICMSGTAAKVDMTSTACSTKMFTPPAMDCYGEYWGAAMGINLNQVIDMTLVPPAGGTPGKYDASNLKGFAFTIDGDTVPAPSSLRFKVDNGSDATSTEFCNVPTVKLKVGANTVLFTDLVKECYKSPVPTEPLATTIQTGIVKISWQVVTNDKSTVPFNFCISDIRALTK